MGERAVVVGVSTAKPEHLDAIALGGLLARVTSSQLLLVSAFDPSRAAADGTRRAHEHALQAAADRFADRLDGLQVEQVVAPGRSAANVLIEIASERQTEAIVLASSRRAPYGQVELGRVTQHLLDGSAMRTAVAPRGFAEREGRLQSIGVGYACTAEADDALRYAGWLAKRAGARLRVLTAFDPADRELILEHSHSEGELAARAQAVLECAGEVLPFSSTVTGALLEGDAVEALTAASGELDLLILGSRGHERPRVALLSGTAGPLLHHARCALMVAPRPARSEPEGSQRSIAASG